MMNTLRAYIVAALVVSFIWSTFFGDATALAAPPTACKAPTPAQTLWLGSEWAKFLPSVRVCPVHHEHAKTTLLIVSVWAAIYYADKPSGTETVRMPAPLIFTADGKIIGALPMNYPDDPPNTLVLSFRDWKDDYPHRIEMKVSSPTASGDQVLPPLVWDEAKSNYSQSP
jgi:hypothetical protein